MRDLDRIALADAEPPPCGFGQADLAGRWSLRGTVQQRDDDFPPAGVQRDLRARRETFRAADGTVLAHDRDQITSGSRQAEAVCPQRRRDRLYFGVLDDPGLHASMPQLPSAGTLHAQPRSSETRFARTWAPVGSPCVT